MMLRRQHVLLLALACAAVLLLVVTQYESVGAYLAENLSFRMNESLAGNADYFLFHKSGYRRGPLNTSVAYATEYYESIGYSTNVELTGLQASKGLWMSLSINLPCDRYFDDFLLQSKMPSGPWPPPKTAPVDLRDKYFLGGRIARESSWYFAQRYEGALKPHNWTVEFVGNYMKKAAQKGNFHYGADTQQIYNLLGVYDLTNLNGLVIGSEVPWVEAILLTHGNVSSILTVEYHPIVSTHPQISTVLPSEFNRDWRKFAAKKFDFVFSYSSLEHSGLGRYGDRLDPNGDLKDLHKISCLLQPGAMVFLGIPVGDDRIEWNAHRIYGQWRLPLITANFEVLTIRNSATINDPMKFIQVNAYRHAIIVMRKTSNNTCC